MKKYDMQDIKYIPILIMIGVLTYEFHFVATNCTFYVPDPWKFMMASEEIISHHHANFSQWVLNYPNVGYQVHLALVSLISGVKLSPKFLRMLSTFLGLLVPIFIYLSVREIDNKIAKISALIAIIGTSPYYLYYLLNPTPHSVGLFLIAPLLYLNIKYLHKSVSKKMTVVSYTLLHLSFFLCLLLVHNNSALMYMLFYIVLASALFYVNKKDTGVLANYFAVPTLFTIILVYFPYNAMLYRTIRYQLTSTFFEQFLIFWKFLPLLIILLLAANMFFIQSLSKFTNFKRTLKKPFEISSSERNLYILIPFIFMAYAILSFIFYLQPAYFTEKNFVSVFFSHVDVPISFIVIMYCTIATFNRNSRNTELFLILVSFGLVSFILFLISFPLLNYGITIIFPWRHLAYLSLVIPIGLGFMLARIKTPLRSVAVVLFVVVIIMLSIPCYPWSYNDNEITSTKWFSDNSPDYATFTSDNRLLFMILALSDRTIMYELSKESILGNAKNFPDYTFFDAKFIEEGAILNDLTYKKLPRDSIKKLENNPKLSAVYSNNEVKVFKEV